MPLSGFRHHVCHLLGRNYGSHHTLCFTDKLQYKLEFVHTLRRLLWTSCCAYQDRWLPPAWPWKVGLYLPNASHQPLRFHNVCCSEQMNQLWTPTGADGLQATRLQPSFLKWPCGIWLQVSYIWQTWSGTCQALICIFRQCWHNHSGQKDCTLSLY